MPRPFIPSQLQWNPQQERQLVIERLPVLWWQFLVAGLLALPLLWWLTQWIGVVIGMWVLWVGPALCAFWISCYQVRQGINPRAQLIGFAGFWSFWMGMLQSLSVAALLLWLGLTGQNIWSNQAELTWSQGLLFVVLLMAVLSACGFWQTCKQTLQNFASNHLGGRMLLRPHIDRLHQWGLVAWLLLGLVLAGLWWLSQSQGQNWLEILSPLQLQHKLHFAELPLLLLWGLWLWGLLVAVRLGHLIAGYLDLGTAGDDSY